MSTDKIAAGLAARRGSGALRPALSITSLSEMAQRATGAVASVRATQAKAQAELAKRLAEIDSDFDRDTIAEERPDGTRIRKDRAAIAILKRAADTRRARAVKEHMKATQALLDERRKELAAALEAARASRLDDPLKWASQHGVGSEETDWLIRRYQMMGPAALRDAAEGALAGRNKNQCAALCAAISAMPAKDRPFAPSELAAGVFAEEAAKGASFIRAIEFAIADLETTRRELDQHASAGSVADARIRRGLIKDSGSEWGDAPDAA